MAMMWSLPLHETGNGLPLQRSLCFWHIHLLPSVYSIDCAQTRQGGSYSYRKHSTVQVSVMLSRNHKNPHKLFYEKTLSINWSCYGSFTKDLVMSSCHVTHRDTRTHTSIRDFSMWCHLEGVKQPLNMNFNHCEYFSPVFSGLLAFQSSALSGLAQKCIQKAPAPGFTGLREMTGFWGLWLISVDRSGSCKMKWTHSFSGYFWSLFHQHPNKQTMTTGGFSCLAKNFILFFPIW